MSSEASLKASLDSLDAATRITEFVADGSAVTAVALGCERLALWVNTIRSAEPENPSLPFLFEMQRSSHDVAALLATAFYVPAAAAMRSSCETAMYYSFFRSHTVELTTLATDPSYYISKKEILDFHKQHSPAYVNNARDFGFPSILNEWYSRVSAVVHGQLPGAWGRRVSLDKTKHDQKVLAVALKTFAEGVHVIDLFLLLTVGAELWGRVHHESKKLLLKGVPAPKRALLGLDGH